MSTSTPKYPTELLWNGRAVDDEFAADELLFVRIGSTEKDGRISGADIRCPDMSVNRGKYSKPEHVLYAELPRFLDWGIAQFAVGDIPPKIWSGDGRDFDFRIFHDPIKPPEEKDENYAHSEIRAFHNGVRCPEVVPNAVKKKFRQLLSEKVRVLKKPETAF